jgi:hypothetical protein
VYNERACQQTAKPILGGMAQLRRASAQILDQGQLRHLGLSTTKPRSMLVLSSGPHGSRNGEHQSLFLIGDRRREASPQLIILDHGYFTRHSGVTMWSKIAQKSHEDAGGAGGHYRSHPGRSSCANRPPTDQYPPIETRT